jgi:predicted transposase/invertase (TIGR01784 family)
MTKNENEFIMLPTVDFCFKELMQNPRVRKGFIAALLRISPEKIRRTTLQPTILDKQLRDDKIGILDVCVTMTDGTAIDMEMQVAPFEYWEKRVLFYLGKMYVRQIKEGESYEKLKKCVHVSVLNFEHIPDDKCYHTINFRDEETGRLYTDLFELKILELSKLPKFSDKTKGDEEVMRWMRFFNGRKKEEFADMAKGDEYLGEAYQALLKLSADEEKRLEYEAREKALRDYNSQMQSARKQGWKQGEEIGRKRGEEIGRKRGEEIGRKRGEEIGQKRGEERVNLLIRKLLETGRKEDIVRVVSDSEFQKELMDEYGI